MRERQAGKNDELYPTAALCGFIADLRFEAIPPRVIQFTKGLLIDWLGSALAGKGAPQVEAIERFALAMGPKDGPSTIVTSRRKTSP